MNKGSKWRPSVREEKKQPRSALEKFAHAKRSTYDPTVRKLKQQALNANTVNKYRKIQKRVQREWAEAGIVGKQEDSAQGNVTGGLPSPDSDRQPEFNPDRDPNEDHATADGRKEGKAVGNAGRSEKKGKPRTQATSLQRLAAKTQQEKEAARLEIEARQKAISDHWAKVASDKKRRAEENRKMRKKNAKGQPVMKHRIEKILDKLEGV